MANKSHHVVPSSGGWSVKKGGAEKVLSAIHACLDYIQTAKMENQFKSTRAVFAYN